MLRGRVWQRGEWIREWESLSVDGWVWLELRKLIVSSARYACLIQFSPASENMTRVFGNGCREQSQHVSDRTTFYPYGIKTFNLFAFTQRKRGLGRSLEPNRWGSNTQRYVYLRNNSYYRSWFTSAALCTLWNQSPAIRIISQVTRFYRDEKYSEIALTHRRSMNVLVDIQFISEVTIIRGIFWML